MSVLVSRLRLPLPLTYQQNPSFASPEGFFCGLRDVAFAE